MDYIKKKSFKNRLFQIISLPVIWSGIIPVIIIDIWGEVYHRICFPLYGLKYVRRKDYIKIDRHKLKYLNWYQKIGCAYCGYVNGVLAFFTEVVGRTEQYWCGIKHEKGGRFKEPRHQKDFVEYGDREAFVNKYKK